MEINQSAAFTFPKKTELPAAEPVLPVKGTAQDLQQIGKESKAAKETIIDKVDSMNKFLEPAATSVKFRFHEELGEYYVQVIDSVTDEIIREIPNKNFLDLYASMAEFAGLFIDEKR